MWKCQISAPVQTTIRPVAFSFLFFIFFFSNPTHLFPSKNVFKRVHKTKKGLGGGHKQVRWVIRKSNTLRGIIVCLSIHLSALSITIAAAARRVSQQASIRLQPPLHPQPGAGKRLRNGHCFFRGGGRGVVPSNISIGETQTQAEKKEAGLRDKQNPPRHKPVPDFLPQPLFSSRVRVCFRVFFFLIHTRCLS